MPTADRSLIVAIVGTSFSGSTLANLILGAHPDVFAGGELSALVLRHNHEAITCSSCGPACVHWTRETRSAVSRDNIYRLTKDLFKKNIIVDSSKSVDWFVDVLGRAGNAGFSPSYVLMVKHPIRYLASCMVNIAGASPRSIRRKLLNRLAIVSRRAAVIDEWINDLDRFYSSFFRNQARDLGGATFHVLHYERLIEDPSRALSPLLASLGLTFRPLMTAYYETEFHQIAGNAGATFQLKREWAPGNEGMPNFRRKFYEENRSLKIDNKFMDVFSAAELALLKSHPVVRRLTEELGYNHPAMPYRV